MKKFVLITLSFIMITSFSQSQDVLDVEKYKDAELFVVKSDYDVQQRLKEISEIVGKQVTVYEVSGKKLTIKLTYTGIAEMANYANITDKSKATLITVKVTDSNGSMKAYFPLTNDSKYRIYLTEKMNGIK